MDIKAKVEEIVKKITSDKDLQKEFSSNPTKAVEKVAGVDLPDGSVEKVVAAVQAKLTGDKIAGGLDKLKDLF